MDRTKAIAEEVEEIKARSEKAFKEKVRSKIYEITNLSEELRRAKRELAEFKYEEPDFSTLELTLVLI